MASRPAPQRPEWLVPGAQVVVRTSSGYGGRVDVKRTTVKTVATHSFTINGSTDRYRVGTQDHHGSGSFAWFSQVFPLDSSDARNFRPSDTLEPVVTDAMVDAAFTALPDWISREPIRDSMRAAIAAALRAQEASDE